MNAEKSTKVKYFTIIILLIPALALLAGIAFARVESASAEDYLLVAPVFIPGGGEEWEICQPVLAYEFMGTGPVSSLPSIPDEAVCDPAWAAFDAQGELFVSNRNWNTGGGSILRFRYDPAVGFIPYGSITDETIQAPHGIAFSPWGELFVANYLNGIISRYTFDEEGNATPNGVINTGMSNLGVEFNEEGELFCAPFSGDTVYRYTFDPATREAIPNGSFIITGASGLEGMAFSPSGEMFAGSIYTNQVFRVTFDLNGDPADHGFIQMPEGSGPAGVAFSPEGELFVGNHFSGGISRFLFDMEGNAISNGTIATPSMGGLAIFDGVPATRVTMHLPLMLDEFLPGQSPTPPPEGPVPGEWNGTTSYNNPISFEISSDSTQWSDFRLEFDWTGCGANGTTTIVIPGPGSITDNTFSYSETSGYSFNGEFTDQIHAEGLYALMNYQITLYYPIYCSFYLTQNGAWTASAP